MKVKSNIKKRKHKKTTALTASKSSVGKRILALLRKICSWMKFNTITTILALILAAIPIIITYFAYKYTISKDQRELNLYIDDYEIENNQNIVLLYLCSTNKVIPGQYFNLLPLSFINKQKNNIENFICDVVTDLKLNPNYGLTHDNKRGKYSTWQRFLTNDKVWDSTLALAKRKVLKDKDKGKEVVRYIKRDFNSQSIFEINEYFRIDTTTMLQFTPLGYETPLKEKFTIELSYIYKDIDKSFFSSFSIGILDFNNLEELINFIDEEGVYPLNPKRYSGKHKTPINADSYFVMIPKKEWDPIKNGYYFKTTKMETYRLEYSNKDFYTKRRLKVFDKNKNMIQNIKFKDIDKSHPNMEKALDIIMYDLYLKGLERNKNIDVQAK